MESVKKENLKCATPKDTRSFFRIFSVLGLRERFPWQLCPLPKLSFPPTPSPYHWPPSLYYRPTSQFAYFYYDDEMIGFSSH